MTDFVTMLRNRSKCGVTAPKSRMVLAFRREDYAGWQSDATVKQIRWSINRDVMDVSTSFTVGESPRRILGATTITGTIIFDKIDGVLGERFTVVIYTNGGSTTERVVLYGVRAEMFNFETGNPVVGVEYNFTAERIEKKSYERP